MQDLCVRISCAYLCVRTSASGSCMTTCARSLYADLLCKISLSGCLHQDPVGPLAQDLCTRISCARSLFQDLCRTTCRRPPSRLHKRNFTSIPCDGHTPSPQRAILGNQNSQLYQHFVPWTHTISAEGCTSKSKNRNFTSISRDGHARSPQMVALRNHKPQLYLHSVPSTRTISAEGCPKSSKRVMEEITMEKLLN